MNKTIALLIASLGATTALADEPEIMGVKVEHVGMDWRVDVTILHADAGWDHYADGWEIVDADGNRLAYRLLRHPHVNEQPFTRSLNNVEFPDGTHEVFIRASCSTDGWSDKMTRVELKH